LRGGSWYLGQDVARADGRYYALPFARINAYDGFRVVCGSPMR